MGHKEAHRPFPARRHVHRGRVGLVAQGTGDGDDLLPRFFAYMLAAGIVEHERDRRPRNAHDPRHLYLRNGFSFFHLPHALRVRTP